VPSHQSLQDWQLAEKYWRARDAANARATYERLLQDPDLQPMAHFRLSQVALFEGRLQDSTREALAAFNKRPRDADMLVALAKQLASLGEARPAVECVNDPVVRMTTKAVEAMEAGKLMASIGLPEQSSIHLRKARSLGMDSASLRYLMGLNDMYMGDSEGAIHELEASLRAQPGMGVALWALSKLRAEASGQEDWIQELRSACVARRLEPDLPLVKYALFRALDAKGETDAAWQALTDGMRLRRQQVRYDASEARRLFDFMADNQPRGRSDFSNEGPQPIFIVGMPRSGTTLLERILGSHEDIHDAGELYDLVWQMRWMCDKKGGPYLDLDLAQKAVSIDFKGLGRRYLDHTQWRAGGHRFYIDKMPANFMNIPFIVHALPQAKILHMRRGAMDTCFSNLKECFANGYPHSYDQIEMADHYSSYRKLMDQWHNIYPGKIHDVSYDELVADPEQVVREVLNFCGLPWRPGLSAIENRKGVVVTASAVQVREPIHSRFREQWRRYEMQLQPMRERLGAFAD
jgi:tetratricopeptide (TPR) repeat protein